MRWPSLALGVLIALPVVVFPLRCAFEAEPSAHTLERPWVDQLWITAGEWPVVDGEPVFARGAGAAMESGSVLAEYAARSTHLEFGFAPTLDVAVNAAAMFTGQWPTTLGFQERGGKVDPKYWTMPKAARDHGARTTAFLQDLLVTDLGLLGFDASIESAELGIPELVAAVAADWERHPDQPSFTWVHLNSAGAGAANVAALLAGLEATGLDAERRAGTLVAIVGLSTAVQDPSTDPRANPLANDDRFHVPVHLSLPGDLEAGKLGTGTASLVDLPWAAIGVAKWRQPTPQLDGRPSIIASLSGAFLPEWCLMLAPDGHVLRNADRRYAAPGRPPARLPDVSVSVPDPTAPGRFVRSLEPPVVEAGRIEYKALVEELLDL